MIRFDILNEAEKNSFANVLDWHRHYKPLKCEEHLKSANLNLLIDRSGSNVAISACCEDFFLKIVERRSRFRRLGGAENPGLM